jgi:hypothetical protein
MFWLQVCDELGVEPCSVPFDGLTLDDAGVLRFWIENCRERDLVLGTPTGFIVVDAFQGAGKGTLQGIRNSPQLQEFTLLKRMFSGECPILMTCRFGQSTASHRRDLARQHPPGVF